MIDDGDLAGPSRLVRFFVRRSTRATATIPGSSSAPPLNGSGILTESTFIDSIRTYRDIAGGRSRRHLGAAGSAGHPGNALGGHDADSRQDPPLSSAWAEFE